MRNDVLALLIEDPPPPKTIGARRAGGIKSKNRLFNFLPGGKGGEKEVLIVRQSILGKIVKNRVILEKIGVLLEKLLIIAHDKMTNIRSKREKITPNLNSINRGPGFANT